MSSAFVAYPITEEFRKKLDRNICGNIDYISISELRSMRMANLFIKLKNITGENVYLIFEDEESGKLLPVLSILACFTSARNIIVVNPDTAQYQIGRLESAFNILSLVMSSVVGLFTLAGCFIELILLKYSDKRPVIYDDSKFLCYLKTNLWFGVKAGGSIGHIAGVVNSFSKKGWNLKYYSMDKPAMLNEEIEKINIIQTNKFVLPAETNLYISHKNFLKQVLNKSGNLFRSVVYQRLSLGNYSGVIISRKLNRPLIIEYNGSEVWVAKNWGAGLVFEKLARLSEDISLKHADIIMTVSRPLKEELLERGVNPGKIVFYPNCVDTNIYMRSNYDGEMLASIRKRHDIDDNAIVVTFIGTFGRWHGVDVLAESIKRIINNNDEWMKLNNLHFLVIGDGLKMQEFRNILGDEVYNNRLTITGMIAQNISPEYMAISDIFVSPHVENPDGSEFFGSPTKLFEYMAMEGAIIASNLGQMKDVLEGSLNINTLMTADHLAGNDTDKQCGVFITPGSVEELVRAIMYLSENKEYREIIGQNARARVIAKYTWSIHVDKIIDRLNKLAN